jgi:hypothetical protein
MTENNDVSGENPKIFHIVARDSNGEIASQGRVVEAKLKRARRLFLDEGWTLTVTEVTESESASDATSE